MPQMWCFSICGASRTALPRSSRWRENRCRQRKHGDFRGGNWWNSKRNSWFSDPLVMTNGKITRFNGNITIFKGNITMFNGNITVFKGNITIFNGNITIFNGNMIIIAGVYHLVMTNIAMVFRWPIEIDGLPIKMGGFSMANCQITRWYIKKDYFWAEFCVFSVLAFLSEMFPCFFAFLLLCFFASPLFCSSVISCFVDSKA